MTQAIDKDSLPLNQITKLFGDNGESAIEDYSQLLKAYPNAKKFLKALQSNIESHIPTTEDLQSPERMGEWSLAAALNQPTGLTFIGKNARNWDAQSAKLAEEKLNAGVDPAEVWREHLIGRMPDKTLFSEIDDSGMITKDIRQAIRNRELIQRGPAIHGRLSGAIEHPELDKNYPFINGPFDEQSKVQINLADSGGSYGGRVLEAPIDGIKINKSITAHELQHAIQNKENWAMGGSPEEMREEALAMLRRDVASGEIPSTEQAMSMLPMAQHNAYRRLTGEAQARATQDRLYMDMAQRRENYPLAGGKLSDIPLDELIYKYEGNGPSLQEIFKGRVKHYADGGSVETKGKGNGMAEAKSIPQNAALSKLSELLSKAKDIGNKVDLPVIGGLGDLVVGETPSEIENWSYGNYPIQTTEMGLPQIKRERKQSLADAVMALAPIAKATEGLPAGLSIKAYHGSPRKFDKFDMDKIGTGEGAQAYGHGLYFAQKPEVAEEYRDALSRKIDVNGQTILNANKKTGSTGDAEVDDYLVAHNGDINKALSEAKNALSDFVSNAEKGGYYDYYLKENQNIVDKLQALKDSAAVKTGTHGAIYQTSIQWPDAAREAADPLGEHHLLDLDKPYAEQSNFVKEKLLQLNDPHITKAINELPKFNSDGDYWDYMGNSYESKREALEDVTPEDLIRGNRGNFKNPAEVSKLLNQMGIPGSKYLDQGSRTGGGTSNYVMFGDEYPQIVNRAGSLDELQEKYAGGGAVIKAVKSLAKNLNKDLIEKYLSEGKLSPDDMAQYEQNALAMETPLLQRYNVANAEMQIPDTKKRAKSIGFMTQPSKEQYHLTRNDWENNIPDLTKSDLGFHTGSIDQANYRGKAFDYNAVGQSVIPIAPNKYTNYLKLNDLGSFHADSIAPQLEKKKMLAKGKAKQIQSAIDNDWKLTDQYDQQMRDVLSQHDIDAIKYANEQEGEGLSYAHINPSMIRSRFAAFDPLRKESSSLLAGTALGDLLLKYASPETNSDELQEKYAAGGAVIKAVKSLAKNLNKDLIEKYLSTGKLSPEEMAQYETNAVQMTDSGKHHYNLANANAQGGTPESRAVDLGFDTPAFHGQTRQEDFWGKQPDILSSIDDESGNAELGRFFSTNSPSLAGKYAGDKRQSGAVYPLILKSDDIYKADTNNWDAIKSRIVESGIRNADANNFNTALFENVRDSPSYNPISDFKSNVFASKGGLRSRFAAFDPLRKDSKNLLAGTALGDLLLKYASQETSSPEKPDNYAQGGAVQYADGGDVDLPELGETSHQSKIHPYHRKFTDTMSGDNADITSTGVTANTDLGDFGVSMMDRSITERGRENALKILAANYGIDLGDLRLDASVLKPTSAQDVYIGMLNGSIPVGEGRAMLGLQGMKTPMGSDIDALIAGYQGKVGDGYLTGEFVEPIDHSPAGRQVQLQYSMPFAQGGAVQYNPAKIDAIIAAIPKFSDDEIKTIMQSS